MKRTLALLLVVAMLVCMIPAFALVSSADDEVQYGLNADFYQLTGLGNQPDSYRGIIGTSSGEGSQAGYNDAQRYDQSIEALLAISTPVDSPAGFNETEFPPSLPAWNTNVDLDWEGYMIKWTGTVTAKTAGTYYLVGRKIDNGFVAFVKQGGEMTKVYEYWTGHHWFDTDGNALRSNLGGFTLKAGEAVEVELWYMEANGGQILDMGVSTSENGDVLSLADAGLTFDLDAQIYRTNLKVDHDLIKNVLPTGVTAGGEEAVDDNGCPADAEGNHHYDDSIDAIKALMTKVGSTVVANYESNAWEAGFAFGMRDEDCLVEYNGYVTPNVGGTYQFGTSKVDNCLMVEIEIDGKWVRVYEFWAKNVWNDNSTTYSDTTVTLEKDKSYKIHATFLEINGGQAIESKILINDEEKSMKDSGLVFTTTEPKAPLGVTTITYFDRGQEWYYMTSGMDNDQVPESDNWMTDASVYTQWETAYADFGSAGSNAWETNDSSSVNSDLWVVKEFTVENVEDIATWAVMTELRFDDNITLYLNGSPVFINGGWNDGYVTYKLAEEASSLLKTGTNTVAAHLHQGHGGYAFDMALYATMTDTSAYAPSISTISTADQLLKFVASANANPSATKGQVVSIAADIDMTGKTWTPLTSYYGLIEGNGHTISNITYAPSVSAVGAHEGTPVGILVNVLGNNSNVKGQIQNLTLDNCTLDVTATEGAERAEWVIAGGIAGLVDRGYIFNCTVSNTTIKGTSVAGGVAGVASYAYDSAGVYVMNCTVDATVVEAKQVAGTIIGYARGGDTVIIGNATIGADGTSITAPVTGVVNGDVWYGNETLVIDAVNTKKSLSVSADKDFEVYTQSRVNAEDESLSDYRVVIVAKTDWLKENYYKGFKVEFSNGTTTKSFTAASTTAFKTVTAAAENGSDIYTAVGDTVVFGWVVTEVPEGYAPTAVTLGNLTLPE